MMTKWLPPHDPIKYGFDTTSKKETRTSPVVENDTLTENGQFTPSYDERLWLFHHLWEPPPEIPVRATLMILHGTVDHSGVYKELATTYLNPQGIAVFAMDMRGWGLSDGESMYFYDMDTYIADVENFYNMFHTMERYRTVTSRFLLGKSLGGTLAAFCAAQFPRYWTGLIGLSGAFNPVSRAARVPSPLAMSILRSLSGWIPKMPLRKMFQDEAIVADASALQAWRNDVLCSKDMIRVGYAVEVFRCTREIEKTIAPSIDIPMLLLWGEDDLVVDISGHEMMKALGKSQDKELKRYPGGRHNLLQEPSLTDQVSQDILDWIIARSVPIM
jgi:alpha-beta hydrolase superfamily lysophospholipase